MCLFKTERERERKEGRGRKGDRERKRGRWWGLMRSFFGPGWISFSVSREGGREVGGGRERIRHSINPHEQLATANEKHFKMSAVTGFPQGITNMTFSLKIKKKTQMSHDYCISSITRLWGQTAFNVPSWELLSEGRIIYRLCIVKKEVVHSWFFPTMFFFQTGTGTHQMCLLPVFFAKAKRELKWNLKTN